MPKYEEKNVVIAGARRGLGKVLAYVFASSGYNLIINDKEDMEIKERSTKLFNETIAPGWIKTEMNEQLPQELVDEETDKIYLKRFAEPEEIAKFILFLASDECSYLNGEVIKIDEGY